MVDVSRITRLNNIQRLGVIIMKLLKLSLFIFLWTFGHSLTSAPLDSVIGCVSSKSCFLGSPAAIAIDGNRAYVCNESGNSVSVIDLNRNEVIACIHDYGSPCQFNAPGAIAINYSKAYVCYADSS